ncbi:MAG: M42 family metallopeptidase [Desulfitobacteriia bacterium]|jgi:putative aminopeptidase FrvX
MLLKELCLLNGVAGNEKVVRDYILERLKDKIDDYKIDKIGNLIVSKKGMRSNSPTVLLCAHMDEVGLFITDITSDGYLKFQTVGGIEPEILISKTVLCGPNEVPGVIGSKAIHLQKPKERKKTIDLEDLFIDIGAESQAEAEEVVSLGDYVAFIAGFEAFGSDLLQAKAFDDRAGCAIIMETLANRYSCDLLGAFTVQEEVGLRGSKVVSNYITADLAIIIEATRAKDFISSTPEDWLVELEKGPACSLMDARTIYSPELISKVMKICQKYDLPLQYRRGTAAANDAGNLHLSGKGIPVISLSLPCRNIHTMNSLISNQDYENCRKIVHRILENIEFFCSQT